MTIKKAIKFLRGDDLLLKESPTNFFNEIYNNQKDELRVTKKYLKSFSEKRTMIQNYTIENNITTIILFIFCAGIIYLTIINQ